MQLVQAPADEWELGKEALGLGETTPEGEEGTGIANGVPFVVRYRYTVGSLEAEHRRSFTACGWVWCAR